LTGATAPAREPGEFDPEFGMKRTLVNGAGGFIGGHLVKRLKAEGCWVRGVDLKPHAFTNLPADEFIAGDLRDPGVVSKVVRGLYRHRRTRRRVLLCYKKRPDCVGQDGILRGGW
jgi:hypothetical protein